MSVIVVFLFFFFQAEDGIRDYKVTGVQTCALPISSSNAIVTPAPGLTSSPIRGSPRGAARAALTAAPRSSRGASVVASTLESVRVRDGSVAVSMVSPYGSSTFTHRILPSSGTLDKHSRSAESSGGGELLARDRHRAMKPPEVIETDRLRLRRPVMEDAAAIFSTYAQDPEVARFVSWSVHPSVDVTRKFVEEYGVAGCMTGEGVLRRWVVMPRQGPTPRDVWCFARVREREATR